MKQRIWLGTFCILCSLAALAQPLLEGTSNGQDFQVEQLTDRLTNPWGLVFIRPQQLLITERTGSLRLLNLADGSQTQIKGLPPVAAGGQGGLMDIITGPEYETEGWLYFTYSKMTDQGPATALARAKLAGDELTSWQTLMITASAAAGGRHFGSRIAFDEAGYVYVSVGDRGHRPNGQDRTTHAGSILRLHLDGRLPSDNPFVELGPATSAIWSYGHRNPQGLAFDAKNQRLWAIEHGPRGGDELNLIEKGANYGWPLVSHGKEYWGPLAVGNATTMAGMVDPEKIYIPSIAPSSLLLYQGEAFPNWQGNLFAGALVKTHLNRLVLNDAAEVIEEERLLAPLNERIRALTTDENGWLYLATDGGRLLRITP